MIFLFILLIVESGEKSPVRTVHSLEVGMHGAEVEIQAASISLAGNFHRPSKGPSTITTTFGILSRLLENGQDWRLKVRGLLPEVGIE